MHQLRYFFDPGSGICLWSSNDMALDKFGYPVDLDVLPLTEEAMRQGQEVIAQFETSLDWVNPAGASPWSNADEERFYRDSNDFLIMLGAVLGPDYEVLDERR